MASSINFTEMEKLHDLIISTMTITKELFEKAQKLFNRAMRHQLLNSDEVVEHFLAIKIYFKLGYVPV